MYSSDENRYVMVREVHDELVGMVEDCVSQFCDDHMVSGELAWIIVDARAQARIAQLKGECQ